MRLQFRWFSISQQIFHVYDSLIHFALLTHTHTNRHTLIHISETICCVMDLFGLPLSLLMGFVCSLSRLFCIIPFVCNVEQISLEYICVCVFYSIGCLFASKLREILLHWPSFSNQSLKRHLCVIFFMSFSVFSSVDECNAIFLSSSIRFGRWHTNCHVRNSHAYWLQAIALTICAWITITQAFIYFSCYFRSSCSLSSNRIPYFYTPPSHQLFYLSLNHSIFLH